MLTTLVHGPLPWYKSSEGRRAETPSRCEPSLQALSSPDSDAQESEPSRKKLQSRTGPKFSSSNRIDTPDAYLVESLLELPAASGPPNTVTTATNIPSPIAIGSNISAWADPESPFKTKPETLSHNAIHRRIEARLSESGLLTPVQRSRPLSFALPLIAAQSETRRDCDTTSDSLSSRGFGVKGDSDFSGEMAPAFSSSTKFPSSSRVTPEYSRAAPSLYTSNICHIGRSRRTLVPIDGASEILSPPLEAKHFALYCIRSPLKTPCAHKWEDPSDFCTMNTSRDPCQSLPEQHSLLETTGSFMHLRDSCSVTSSLSLQDLHTSSLPTKYVD